MSDDDPGESGQPDAVESPPITTSTPQPYPHYPGAQYSVGPAPYRYPYPPAPAKPPLRFVAATRLFAFGSMTGFVLIILFGFLTFTYVTPKASGEDSMISGWGKWAYQGSELPLHHGASAIIVPGVLLPLLILLPAVLMAILIASNIARRGLAVTSTLFAVVATLVALFMILNPSDVVITFSEYSNRYIDDHYEFRAGPSAILTALSCAGITLCCVAGIAFGGKTKPQAG